jgi:hypothetical protein
LLELFLVLGKIRVYWRRKQQEQLLLGFLLPMKILLRQLLDSIMPKLEEYLLLRHLVPLRYHRVVVNLEVET